MAWTDISGFDPSPGDVLTAAEVQTYMLDNPDALVRELIYQAATSAVVVSATSEAAPTTVVGSTPSVTVDGSEIILVEFYAPDVSMGSGATLNIALYDGGSSIGMLLGTSVGGTVPLGLFSRRLTPSAGSHTYTVGAWRATANCTINMGAGGAAARMPGFLRISKVQPA